MVDLESIRCVRSCSQMSKDEIGPPSVFELTTAIRDRAFFHRKRLASFGFLENRTRRAARLAPTYFKARDRGSQHRGLDLPSTRPGR